MTDVVTLIPTVKSVTLEDLTTNALNGTGVFDVLMQVQAKYLDGEFQKGRIKGPEYATVYLGSLQHVLQSSIQFLLNKDKSALEALLIEAQIRKVNAEVKLADQQLLIAQAELCNLKAQYDILLATLAKTTEEKEILKWKAQTEKAQTVGGIAEPDSVIGKQQKLYEMQAEGFKRDAEQKAAQIMVNAWSVQRTTDSAISPTQENKLTDSHIGQAVGQLLLGVNAAP